MENIKYDMSNPYLEYKTNADYRKCMRYLFHMDTESLLKDLKEKYETDDMDEESLDELLYSSDTVMHTIDKIYTATKSNPLFHSLYLDAAAKMISLDPSMGQIILFSYNYLYLYHPCLCVFLQFPADFTETCIPYLQLKTKLNER